MAKVMIAIPTGLDYAVDARTTAWCSRMQSKGVSYVVYANRNVDEGRNWLVKNFLKNTDYTHIFWLDSDVVPDEDTIPKLLALDEDIAAGVCPICLGGVPGWSAAFWTSPEHKEIRCIQYHKLPAGVFYPDAVGGTMVLVRRAVYENHKLPWPWYKTTYYASGFIFSEDFYFATRALAAGHKIAVDPSVKSEHYKTVGLREFYKSLIGEPNGNS